jgi:Flp pilus assembly protein TadG
MRGQALIETVLFVPIMLMLMFSVIYLSQIGVAQERAQSAVRYGTLVSAESGYSVEAFYGAFYSHLPSPVPYTAPTSCPGTVAADIGSAINQAQALPTGAPTSFATTQPYWTVASPSVGCTFGEAETSNGAMPGMTTGYVEVMKASISASRSAPGYVKTMFGSAFGIEGQMTVYLPLTIADLVYCSPGIPGGFWPNYGPWFEPTDGNPWPMPWIPDMSGSLNGTFDGDTATPPPAFDINNYTVGDGPAACTNP